VTNIMRICNSLYSTNLRIIKIKSIIPGEHKTTLRFQNDTENKCDVLTTSHVHQSTEKLPKFCTHLTETRSVLHESEGHCRDDNQVSQTVGSVPLAMEGVAVVIRCPNSGKDCVNRYLAEWFHVKLFAKCTLNRCYGLFLR
jgi:hypothetical protein